VALATVSSQGDQCWIVRSRLSTIDAFIGECAEALEAYQCAVRLSFGRAAPRRSRRSTGFAGGSHLPAA